MDHMKKSTEAGLKSKSQEYEYIIEQYKKAHPNENGAPVEPHRVAELACRMREPAGFSERLSN